jgi:GT2 family glycosyltransferase
MTSVKFSVVMPVRDRAHMLPTTLGPLVGRPDCEVVVVDDGSVDDSATIARRCGARVVRLARSAGPAAARNAGVRETTGDVVLFLDSDIVLPKRSLDEFAAAHSIADDVVLVGLRRQLPAAGSSAAPRRDSREALAEIYSYNLARHPQPWAACYTCVLSVPRTVLERASLDGQAFDPEFASWGLEDVELGLRLTNAGARLAFATGVTADHLHHDRTMSTERYLGWAANVERMIRRHPGASRYLELVPAFDPQRREDFVQAFQRFAGPVAARSRAVVVRVRDTPSPADFAARVARTGQEATVYLVLDAPSPVLSAVCATAADPGRLALFPTAVWSEVGDRLLAGHDHVTGEEWG